MVDGDIVNIVTTGVDELIEILKKRDKIFLNDAAAMLNTPVSVVQSWVDFLVEEKVLGIEFKFTKPYIYLNRQAEEKKQEKKEVLHAKAGAPQLPDISVFKLEFKKRAREKNIPESKVHVLWQNHLANELELKKQFFYIEAKKRDFFNIDNLWSRYGERLLNL